MPVGSNFVQSSAAPALSVITPIAPHLNGKDTPIKTPAIDLQDNVAVLDKKEKARRRRLKEKKALEARRKELRKVPSVPFRTAPLLSADCYVHQLTAEGLDLYWRGAIRAVWDLGPKASFAANEKAARDYLAKQHLLPAEIAALARILIDFNRSEAEWGTPAYRAKCEWLERVGLLRPVRHYGPSALRGAVRRLSVPLDLGGTADQLSAGRRRHPRDLAYTGWRLPRHGRQRAAERMARFVAWRITDDPSVGMGAPIV